MLKRVNIAHLTLKLSVSFHQSLIYLYVTLKIAAPTTK
ncbi:hypothetical protein VIC_003080 [Vibrio coralliilyticus ATCC BAA-450]|nr:hypothetical protein VIC_003080 [Vibrio coralliilyticus ATCC BAA-450]